MISRSLSPVVRQCLIVIAANLSGLGAGICLGWPSPVLVKLEDRNSTVLSRRLTDEEATWLASLPQLVCAVALLMGSLIIDRIGRKNTFYMVHVPKLVACLFFVFGNEVWQLMLARVCDGVSLAFYYVVLATYTAEIADKNIRGSLGTIIQMFRSVGVLVILCIGPFQSYSAINITYIGISIVSVLPMVLLPETPYFLYSKGKIRESEILLNSLRTTKLEVQAELQMFENNKNKKALNLLELLKQKVFLKAMAITVFLGAIGPFSGFGFVVFYLQGLIQSAGTDVKPETGSLIVGIVSLIACFLPIYTTDRFGRKPILCANMILMACGSVAMGTFFWCKQAGYEINPFLNILPTLCISAMYCGITGYLSILFILIPELFLGKERALGVSTGSLALCLGIFAVSKSYSALVTSSLGFHGSFWMFSVISFVILFFVVFYVPETKGKMFDEIQITLGCEDVKKSDES